MLLATAEASPWVGPAIVAAVVSGVVSLATVAVAGRRERKERHRQLMADAFATCLSYKEFAYKVRRRRTGVEEAADHSRISDDLSTVQAALAGHEARLRVEAPAVAVFFTGLVGATRRIAGVAIREGWASEPVGPDSGSSIVLADMDALDVFEARYLEAVKDHLSMWPYRVCRVVRWCARRRTELSSVEAPGATSSETPADEDTSEPRPGPPQGAP
jgi:hypothetical protein